MNTIVTYAETIFQNSKKSLLNISLVVLTICLEEIVEEIIFTCPCEGHLTYGMIFLWCPAILLFCCGILINKDTWYYLRTHDGCKSAAIFNRKTLEKALEVLARSFVAPAVWLILSLLQKKYLVCALFGPSLHAHGNTGDHAAGEERSLNITDSCSPGKPRIHADEVYYTTDSQILGWCLMIMTLLIVFLSLCIARCGFSRRMVLPDSERCMEIEAKAAAKRFKEVVEEFAKEEGVKRVEELVEESKAKQTGHTNYRSWIDEVGETLSDMYGLYYIAARERDKLANNSPKPVSRYDSVDGGEAHDNIDGKQINNVDTDAGLVNEGLEVQYKSVL